MKECVGDWFLMNGEARPVSIFSMDMVSGRPRIYEVMRVIRGITLFLDEHLERLAKSCRLVGLDYPLHKDSIAQMIDEVVRMNGSRKGNIKLVLPGKSSGSYDLLVYYMEHLYPAPQMYRSGADIVLMEAHRNNPNAKLWDTDLKSSALKYIDNTGAWETLLVSPDGFITEGSRSNFFLVRGNSICTPPADQVLEGVTRAKVIEICRGLSIPVISQKIRPCDIASFEAAFITSTSSKVLPVKKLGDLILTVPHPLVNKIIIAYQEMIDNYILSG
ncbi:MAG: aminotransferase class IV [Bacteroidales bacterium]|nr:aminotransferase class IV [Bacteroidales bacterium]